MGKNVTLCLDFTEEGVGKQGGYLIVKEPSSSTRFKIITPSTTLYLKAESRESRD